MPQSDHLTDRDIILLVDGELRSGERPARDHLDACWSCRSRMEEIQETITDFVRSYHDSLDAQLPRSRGREHCFEPSLKIMGHRRPPAGCLRVTEPPLRRR